MSLNRMSTEDLNKLVANKSTSRLKRIQANQELARRHILSGNAKLRAEDKKLSTQHNTPVEPSVHSGYAAVWDQSLDSYATSTKDEIALSVDKIDWRLDDSQKLREYQKAGIEFALRSYRKWNGVMLAHFAGAGKTRQAAIIQKLSNTRRTLYLTKKGGGLVKKTSDELNYSYKLIHASGETPNFAFPIQSELNVSKDVVRSQFDMAYGLPGNVTIVTNYESLNTFPWIFDYEFDLLIVDEVHKLKGGADYKPTKIWKNTKDFVYYDSTDGVIPKDVLHPKHANGERVKNPQPLPTNVDRFLFLTGTPTNNHPKEYFAYLNIFNPRLFDDRKVIFDTFELIRAGVMTMDQAQVIQLLTPMMHRLTKEDVQDQLPPVNIYTYDVPLSTDSNGVQSQDEVYTAARDEIVLKLSAEYGDAIPMANAITQMTRLRQINVYNNKIDIKKKVLLPSIDINPNTGEIDYKYNDDGEIEYHEDELVKEVTWKNNGKLMAIIEKIEELQFENERVVVFSAQFNDPLYALKAHFDSLGLSRAEIIDGTTKNAADLIDEWQAGKIDILLLNAKVAAEGLNLQRSPKWEGGANHAIFIDKWWSPSIQQQAIARLHRLDTIGPVFVHFFNAVRADGKPTVDALINEINDEKEWWVQNIDNNERFRTIDRKKLEELF